MRCLPALHPAPDATAAGEIPVECLAVGDHVLTRLGSGSAAVVWIGHRQVDCRQHPRPAEIWPVRVRSGAFAPGVPRRDLWLSGDHAVFVDGVLVPVRTFINGTTIVQETRDEVSYWHVELPRHDVLLAEGLPCETYLDTGNRSSFANGGVCVQMHPALSQQGGEAIWEAAGCAPLRITGDEVERCLARLRRRAAGSGAPRGRRIAAGPATCDLASLLRPSWYLASYPDVAAARICAATHYASWGYAEGRLPCPEIDLIRALGLVDPSMLVFTMADVVAAGADPVEHFCTKGWQEQRRPNPYFDTGWYLDQHQVPTGINPLLHYLLAGEARGLPPGPHFDPHWYRRRYALGPTCSPLAHYLMHRRTQRFAPVENFDVTAYVQACHATLRPDRDAYTHYLAIGRFVAVGQPRHQRPSFEKKKQKTFSI